MIMATAIAQEADFIVESIDLLDFFIPCAQGMMEFS